MSTTIKRIVRFHAASEAPSAGDVVTLVRWFDHNYDPRMAGIPGAFRREGWTLKPEARTNLGHEVTEVGPLGSTCGVSEHAHGRFVVTGLRDHDAAYTEYDQDHAYFVATLAPVAQETGAGTPWQGRISGLSPAQVAYLGETLAPHGYSISDDGTVSASALRVLGALDSDADGHYDGDSVWIGGVSYGIIGGADA